MHNDTNESYFGAIIVKKESILLCASVPDRHQSAVPSCPKWPSSTLAQLRAESAGQPEHDITQTISSSFAIDISLVNSSILNYKSQLTKNNAPESTHTNILMSFCILLITDNLP